MFEWKPKYKWGFQEGGIIDSVGPNEADTGIYEGHPYKGLAKEILQNSLDAKDPDLPAATPVIVEFSLLNIPLNEIPGADRLYTVIDLCSSFFTKGDDGEKLKEWKKLAAKYLKDNKSIPILKISDYNTTGLDGVHKLRDTSWAALVRQKGTTNKSNGQGGSHGVGKFAPYSFSAVRTVLYATQNKSGERAFQGKSILTSFEENGKTMQNIGVFGDSTDSRYPAVFDMDDVPEVFRREKNGTDVIAVGFNFDKDWMEQIAISVLQYCFFTIYNGQLLVRIKNDKGKVIELSRDNLDDQMSFYENWFAAQNNDEADFQFTAPKYLQVLRNPATKHYVELFPNKNNSMGNVELFLLVDKELSDKAIYEMRRTGMEIQEDARGNWRIGAHFNGLFIATGEDAVNLDPENNIDSFLRLCEDQAHNEWAAAYYKKDKNAAQRIINGIHKWILAKIKEEMPDLSTTTHDAFGLSIKNQFSTGDDDREEKAFSNYSPLSFETEQIDVAPKKVSVISKPSNKPGKKKEKRKPRTRTGKKKNPNNKQGNKPESVRTYGAGMIQAPYDSSSGKYLISFIPEDDMKDLSLLIKISSDDQNNEEAVVKSAILNGQSTTFEEGRINIGSVNKGERVRLDVELQNSARMALEVTTYVKQ